MKAFFYIKYFENGFQEYFDKVKHCDAIFTFDLEDSIHDFTNNQKSCALKEQYRRILENIVNKNILFIQKSSIAIRINKHSTKEFDKDIELLKRLKDVHWHTIIIPKTESVYEIKFVLQKLKSAAINFKNLSILIESEKGIIALKEIIAEKIKKLNYIQFGHADYNLDKNIFPFIHQYNNEYWRWVERISAELNNTNIIFGNSPCLFLTDDELFTYSLQKLNELFNEKCCQNTLTLRQTRLCSNFKKSDTNALKNLARKIDDKQSFAQEIIRSIELKASDKSFSITANNYLVCPQEAMMAKRFLNDAG